MSTTKQRLVMALAGAGVPVDTVTITGPTSAAVGYMPWATTEQKQQGADILAAFDWSPEAEAEWVQSQTREQAKAAITGATPELLATRAACVALMLSLQEARAKINELITATGASVSPLVTGESVTDAFVTVAQLIDAGAV